MVTRSPIREHSRRWLGWAILVVLLLVGSLMHSHTAAADDTKAVMVSPVPLPVAVTNSATVNLPAGHNVLGGTRALVTVDADNARQPVQGQTEFQLTDGAPGLGINIYTVPAGKRLVIEFLSLRFI